MVADAVDTDERLDRGVFGYASFRNAVYRHWDPWAIDLEADRAALRDVDPPPEVLEGLRRGIALFGAGEQAVTEDLIPLVAVADRIEDQLFLTSQLYEEAKHTVFFDRYWAEVIDPVVEDLEIERTAPTDDRYFNDGYRRIFDRTRAAMEQLYETDTPENRARAICHYHLVVESVLAQTGYHGFEHAAGSEEGPLPELPGLLEGIGKVRSDEGRHVAFGMQYVHELIHEEGVDPAVVEETLADLLGDVLETVQQFGTVVDTADLVSYGQEKLTRRIEVLTDAAADPIDPDRSGT